MGGLPGSSGVGTSARDMVLAPRRLTPRTRLAVRLGLWARLMSRLSGRGAGAVIGGELALRIDPQALTRLAAGRTTVLVTGTNGKTTTTRLLAQALAPYGEVATNAEGANLAAGLVTALARARTAPFAVLEVDEPHLPAVVDAVAPTAVVLLNLSRDQLDRVGEVGQVEERLRAAIAAAPATTVVANVDDVMATSAGTAARHPVWVAAGSTWTQDSHVCPRCGGAITRTHDSWWCACGLRRPRPDWRLESGDLVDAHGGRTPLRLGLPGQINQRNAAMALAGAAVLGLAVGPAAATMAEVVEVRGRYRHVRYAGHDVRLLLAKNPAGWAEALHLVGAGALVVAVNGQVADGTDLSWLYDVPFELLAGRTVFACGERAPDLATRLAYAEVAHCLEPDPMRAMQRAAPGPIDVIANYTAFQSLAGRLPR